MVPPPLSSSAYALAVHRFPKTLLVLPAGGRLVFLEKETFLVSLDRRSPLLAIRKRHRHLQVPLLETDRTLPPHQEDP